MNRYEHKHRKGHTEQPTSVNNLRSLSGSPMRMVSYLDNLGDENVRLLDLG